jgi:hypothetical protein
VFDASARAKDTGRLSTGTAEQLYLALRLALIGQLGEIGAALPVLMDDVFANFDPERRAGAARRLPSLRGAPGGRLHVPPGDRRDTCRRLSRDSRRSHSTAADIDSGRLRCLSP